MRETDLQPYAPERTGVYWRWVLAAMAVVALSHALTLHGHPGPGGDSAELQRLGASPGIPHPSGYPLFLLLSRAWSFLVPLGSQAFRMNLFSLACGLVALAALAQAGRLLQFRGAAAAVALAALGTCSTWWRLSCTTEVYALHTALMAVTLALLLYWHHTDRGTYLHAALLVYGLSFGNHLASVTLAPAFLYAVFRTGWRRLLRPATLAWMVFCAAAALGLYAYLFLHAGSAADDQVYRRLHNFQDLFHHVTGLEYHSQFQVRDTVAGHFLHALALLARILGEWRWLLPLVLLGAIYLEYHDWFAGRLALIYGLVHFLFMAFYRIPDIHDFMLPLLALGFLHLAACLNRLQAWAVRPDTLPAAKRIAGVLLATMAAASAPATWNAFQNLRVQGGIEEVGQLRAALGHAGPAVLVLPHWQQESIARYLQVIDGQGTGRVTLHPAAAVYVASTGARELLAAARAWRAEGRETLVFSRPPPAYNLVAPLLAAGAVLEPAGDNLWRIATLP